nr:Coatomer subunit beta'-1 [Ipomoea batatas]
MLTSIVASEKTCSKIRKSKVSGSTSNRAMDISKFIFRDCFHLELPNSGKCNFTDACVVFHFMLFWLVLFSSQHVSLFFSCVLPFTLILK